MSYIGFVQKDDSAGYPQNRLSDTDRQLNKLTERLTRVETKLDFVQLLQEKLEKIVNEGFDGINDRLDAHSSSLHEIKIQCVKIGFAYSVFVSVSMFLLTQFADKIFK